MEINLLGILILVGAILISITLHEAVHAYTSHWLGDDTAMREGRLTLNPLAHIDPFATVILPLLLVAIGAPPFGAAKPVPFNPYKVRGQEYGAALVGLAGPLTNLALAILVGLIIRLFSMHGESLFIDILHLFVQVNIAFFVFNMIPFPPLDGSRLLYAVAPDGLRAVMRSIEGLGLIGIAVFVLLLFPLVRPFIANIFGFLYQLIVGTNLAGMI